MSNYNLVSNKNIGKVLFIVEGAKTEIFVLKRILKEILNYELVVNKNNSDIVECYETKNNLHSKIYIINAKQSELLYIEPGEEYVENVIQDLIENYEFSIDNTSIYYIYDRDPLNNVDIALIKRLNETYYNSLDNGVERQGLLLLSYPAFESYTLSNFCENTIELEFKLGKDVKKYCNDIRINQNQISEKTIVHASEEFEKAIEHLGISEYNLDDMKAFNKSIFENEEKLYDMNKKYKLLSLLTIAFIDLGIIEIESD